MLCITPSGDGIIPRQAWSGAQAPPSAEKLLRMCGCGLGEERGRGVLWAVQARVAPPGFPVTSQLNFSRLRVQEQRSSLPSRCQGGQLSSAGRNVGLAWASSAAVARPAPTGWRVGHRLTT